MTCAYVLLNEQFSLNLSFVCYRLNAMNLGWCTQEKIVFSTLLAKNISIAEELATTEEWNVLFASDTVIENNNVDNDKESKPTWISTQSWVAIKR